MNELSDKLALIMPGASAPTIKAGYRKNPSSPQITCTEIQTLPPSKPMAPPWWYCRILFGIPALGHQLSGRAPLRYTRKAALTLSADGKLYWATY